MSAVSQGPGWWQAADLKWYPPELHADYEAPSPPDQQPQRPPLSQPPGGEPRPTEWSPNEIGTPPPSEQRLLPPAKYVLIAGIVVTLAVAGIAGLLLVAHPSPKSSPANNHSSPVVPPPITPVAPPSPVGKQLTYTVTGTKGPGDIITVTYIDPSGQRRDQHNVYIPWSLIVTIPSQFFPGSVEASSLFKVSKLNCSIITSDGSVLSSNTNDSTQVSC